MPGPVRVGATAHLFSSFRPSSRAVGAGSVPNSPFFFVSCCYKSPFYAFLMMSKCFLCLCLCLTSVYQIPCVLFYSDSDCPFFSVFCSLLVCPTLASASPPVDRRRPPGPIGGCLSIRSAPAWLCACQAGKNMASGGVGGSLQCSADPMTAGMVAVGDCPFRSISLIKYQKIFNDSCMLLQHVVLRSLYFSYIVSL